MADLGIKINPAGADIKTIPQTPEIGGIKSFPQDKSIKIIPPGDTK